MDPGPGLITITTYNYGARLWFSIKVSCLPLLASFVFFLFLLRTMDPFLIKFFGATDLKKAIDEKGEVGFRRPPVRKVMCSNCPIVLRVSVGSYSQGSLTLFFNLVFKEENTKVTEQPNRWAYSIVIQAGATRYEIP